MVKLVGYLTNFLAIACKSILGTNLIVNCFCPSSTATTYRKYSINITIEYKEASKSLDKLYQQK